MDKSKAADPIIVHPDVRRMLMTMRAFVEGSRAFSTYVAKWLDITQVLRRRRRQRTRRSHGGLCPPVAKAFLTDVAFESAVAGQQVFGGHGFIREWGQEQLVRDLRITQIYEGTNGIQALDLVGRKVAANNGAFYKLLLPTYKPLSTVKQAMPKPLNLSRPKGRFSQPRRPHAVVIARSASNPNEIGAASVEYLHTFGYTAFAFMWAKWR